MASLGILLALIGPFDYCGVSLRRLIEKRAKLELKKNKADAERNEGYQHYYTCVPTTRPLDGLLVYKNKPPTP